MNALVLALLLAAPAAAGVAAPAARPQRDVHRVMWGGLLRETVTGGTVNYAGIRERTNQLDSYLAVLKTYSLENASREERLAFWINAYNACTVKLIMENYPVTSIRNIRNPWKDKRWEVAGGTYSLDQMEHRFMRKELQEPRIHFAIVCASIGCPALWNRAYSADDIDAELDAAARRFMQSKKHVRTELKKGFLGKGTPVLKISSIFKWFKDDFTDGGRRRVADFIARYADAPTAAFIADAGRRLEIEYLPYDWGLNGR